MLIVLVPGVIGYASATPEWYLERGWALLLGAWFAMATSAAPHWSLLRSSVAAVAGVLGLVSLAGLLFEGLEFGPSLAMVADRLVLARVDQISALLEFQLAAAGLDVGYVETGVRLLDTIHFLWPAFLVLGSLAALAAAGCLAIRVVHGRMEVPRLRAFRFADTGAWVLGVGLLMIVLGQEALTRVGANVATVAGGLYILRGLGVLFAITPVVAPSRLVIILVTLLGVLLYPVTVVVVFAFGLGDTWLDFRERVGVLEDRSR